MIRIIRKDKVTENYTEETYNIVDDNGKPLLSKDYYSIIEMSSVYDNFLEELFKIEDYSGGRKKINFVKYNEVTNKLTILFNQWFEIVSPFYCNEIACAMKNDRWYIIDRDMEYRFNGKSFDEKTAFNFLDLFTKKNSLLKKKREIDEKYDKIEQELHKLSKEMW